MISRESVPFVWGHMKRRHSGYDPHINASILSESGNVRVNMSTTTARRRHVHNELRMSKLPNG